MRLLLLGGTQEARHVASALNGVGRLSVVVSVAKGERRPQSYGAPVRIGGWGGEEPFRDWLKSEGVDAILDATHPFAGQMAHRAAQVAADLGIDHLRLIRPPWLPTDDDNWSFVNSEAEAVDHIEEGATVFLATGRRGLHDLGAMPNRRIICRIKDAPEDPFPTENGQYLVDLGPYSVAGEMRVLNNFGVDWLVTRNSGGRGSWPKLEAARNLGIRVAMIRRPPQPDCTRVTNVAEALAWVRRRV